MTDTAYKLTCPESDTGEHEYKAVLDEYGDDRNDGVYRCLKCLTIADDLNMIDMLNAAAREIRRLQDQLARVKASPVPLSELRNIELLLDGENLPRWKPHIVVDEPLAEARGGDDEAGN